MSKRHVSSRRARESRGSTFFRRFPWEKLTIWGLFLLLVYVLRSFFTVIFLTFIFSYIMTNLVRTTHRILSPERERAWLHRLLTVGSFLLLISSLYGLYAFLERPFSDQIKEMGNRARQIDLRTLGSQVLRDTVGAWQYNRIYGDNPERKEQDLENFREQRFTMAAIDSFRERWRILDENFRAWFRAEYGRSRYTAFEGVGELSERLAEWFRRERAEALYEANREEWDARSAADFEKSFHGLSAFEEIPAAQRERARHEWVLNKITEEALQQERETLVTSREFHDFLADRYYEQVRGTETWEELLRVFYEGGRVREGDDLSNEFDFDVALALYRAGRSAEEFNRILNDAFPPEQKEMALENTFERRRKEELAQEAVQGWSFIDLENINHEITNNYIPKITRGVASGGIFLFQFAVQFALSLLLSFFITFDLNRMKNGLAMLKQSRAQHFYNEISPSLAAFGALIGRAFQAQGIIALCNTLLTYALIEGLDVPFETFLCTIVFFCSFIPVLGVVISTVPIALVAYLYRDMEVAALSVAGVLMIHFIETSILNPKILGEMLHLHPVLVLCILAVGEHFFHVWGLLLGVPVMVYIIRYVIMGEDITQLLSAPAPRLPRLGKGLRALEPATAGGPRIESGVEPPPGEGSERRDPDEASAANAGEPSPLARQGPVSGERPDERRAD